MSNWVVPLRSGDYGEKRAKLLKFAKFPSTTHSGMVQMGRGGGVCECEYVNFPMYFTFSHPQSRFHGLSVKYCLGV